MCIIKKRKVLLCVSASFNVVLLCLGCYLVFMYHTAEENAAFPPFHTAANEMASVGYLRISDQSASLMENKEEYQIELLEIERGPTPEFYQLTFQMTAKRDTGRLPENFRLLWFCPEDGFWYVRYISGFAEKMTYLERKQGDTETRTIQVPTDIFAQPGKYRVAWKQNQNQGFSDFDFDNTDKT